jgi:hypothetical protein
MNLKSPILSRRAFLGSAGAVVAVTTAHAAVPPFFRQRPLDIGAFIDGEDGLAGLSQVLETAAFELRVTVASSNGLRGHANKLLTQKASRGPVFEFSLQDREIMQLPDTLLVFGRWNIDGNLSPLLRDTKAIYVDDPLLGVQLGQSTSIFKHLDHSLVGMTSPLDLRVEHAEQRLRSQVMGELQDLTIATRRNDSINRLEGAAVVRRVSQSDGATNVREIFTRNLFPSVLITCARGQLQVPLCSAKQRFLTLPLRLEHFFSVTRGGVRSAMSLQAVGNLAGKIGFSVT